MDITEEKICRDCKILVQASFSFKSLYTSSMSHNAKFSLYPISEVSPCYTEF